MECDLDYPEPTAVPEPVDTWEEDRREAMKQLYSRKNWPTESEKVTNAVGDKVKYDPRGTEIRRRERSSNLSCQKLVSETL